MSSYEQGYAYGGYGWNATAGKNTALALNLLRKGARARGGSTPRYFGDGCKLPAAVATSSAIGGIDGIDGIDDEASLCPHAVIHLKSLSNPPNSMSSTHWLCISSFIHSFIHFFTICCCCEWSVGLVLGVHWVQRSYFRTSSSPLITQLLSRDIVSSVEWRVECHLSS